MVASTSIRRYAKKIDRYKRCCNVVDANYQRHILDHLRPLSRDSAYYSARTTEQEPTNGGEAQGIADARPRDSLTVLK